MDLVKDLIASKGQELIGSLVQSGFTTDQATRFAPEASASAVEALKAAPAAEIEGLAAPGGVGALMDRIDVAGLAAKTGVDSGLATEGLQRLLPVLLEALRSRAGGAAGLATLLGGFGGDAGGLGAVGGLAGKMFDRG